MTDLLVAERAYTAKPRIVRGEMMFLDASEGKPSVRYREDAHTPETDAVYRAREVFVRDARGDALSLDVQGFELARHATAVRDFYDDDEVSSLGRTEAAQLVKRATGAARVFVFDHTRRARVEGAYRQPSTRVHVDYTSDSAPQRVRDFFGDEADALLAKRVAFVNVWRPVRWPAEDWPLALADARSVAPDELIATDIIYPDRRGEIYAAAYNPAQRWRYIPNMGLDEALLIKCYDSRTDVARFTPHTAFADPNTPADAPPRQSIEFRTSRSLIKAFRTPASAFAYTRALGGVRTADNWWRRSTSPLLARAC